MCQYTSYLKTPHTCRACVSGNLMDSGISFLVFSQILLNCVYNHKNLWTKEAKQTCNTFLVLMTCYKRFLMPIKSFRMTVNFICSDFWLVVHYHELPTEWQLQINYSLLGFNLLMDNLYLIVYQQLSYWNEVCKILR